MCPWSAWILEWGNAQQAPGEMQGEPFFPPSSRVVRIFPFSGIHSTWSSFQEVGVKPIWGRQLRSRAMGHSRFLGNLSARGPPVPDLSPLVWLGDSVPLLKETKLKLKKTWVPLV